SGGMKRRANIAAGLLHEPPILFLDEPTVGVDPQSRNFIFEGVAALRRGGATVVYTTHYMEEAERLCDRVAIIDRGAVIALDTPQALISTHGGSVVIEIDVDAARACAALERPVALVANSLGLLLATLTRTPAQATGLCLIVILTSAMLGGVMVPRFVVPPFMQTLGVISPHTWGLQAYQDVLMRGADIAAILPATAILLGFAVAFFGIAVW